MHCPAYRCRFHQITCVWWTKAGITCYVKNRVVLTPSYSVFKTAIISIIFCPSYSSYLAKAAPLSKTVHFFPDTCYIQLPCSAKNCIVADERATETEWRVSESGSGETSPASRWVFLIVHSLSRQLHAVSTSTSPRNSCQQSVNHHHIIPLIYSAFNTTSLLHITSTTSVSLTAANH